MYDPEDVGLMLRKWMRPNGDFQHLPSWRELVVATALPLPASRAGRSCCSDRLTPAGLADKVLARAGLRQVHGDSKRTRQASTTDKRLLTRPAET